jgi:hypothetical protein
MVVASTKRPSQGYDRRRIPSYPKSYPFSLIGGKEVLARSLLAYATFERLAKGEKAMNPTTQHGPLAPYMQVPSEQEMQRYYQQGRAAVMQRANEAEHFLEQNAAAVCIAGVVLGTFVDRRFLLLPLALGGLRLWRSLQQQ